MAVWCSAFRRLCVQLFVARPREAALLLGLVCASAVCHALVWVRFSEVNGAAQTALSKRDEESFWTSRWDLLFIILKLVGTSICENYCAGRLRMLWRSVATRAMLGEYLPDGMGAAKPPSDFRRATSGASDRQGKPFPFYRLKLPSASGDASCVTNPDQRIADDIASAVGDVVDIGRTLLGNVVSFAGFSTIMLQKSPWVFQALLLYALAGTIVTLRGFASGLTRAQVHVRDREADFRRGLVKVDESAEGIAFYGAAGTERRRLLHSLNRLLVSSFNVLHWQIGLQTFQRTYNWLTIILPSVIMAPQYFRGEVEFGAISQMFFAFNSVKGVLMFVANNFGALAALRAKLERMEALHHSLALDDGEAPEKQKFEDVSSLPLVSTQKAVVSKILREWHLEPLPGKALLSLEAVRIAAPSGATTRWLGTAEGNPAGTFLRLLPGEALLLRGPSGIGKSSLLRVVAGLWDEGAGMVQIGTKDVFFLPQTPYLPFGANQTASSFREQLLFPEELPSNSLPELRNGQVRIVPCKRTDAKLPCDEHLLEAVEASRLGDVLKAAGSLDVEMDWSTRLSGGERQRLAFARLFVRLRQQQGTCAGPALVLLDEATSACDEEAECSLYQELLRRLQVCGGALLSVGHRSSLRSLHTRDMELRALSSLGIPDSEGIRKRH